MTKIVVFAYGLVGFSCLQRLLDLGEKVVGVFTHTDSPNDHIWFGSVAELAESHSIPVWTYEHPKSPEFLRQVQSLEPDLIFSFYYKNMLPQAVLDCAPLGAYNIHGSLLPKFRGRVPVNWAIIHGEHQTGATLHRMQVTADSGYIIDQEMFSVSAFDNAAHVTISMAKAATDILERQIEPLKKGRAIGVPQIQAQASYFGKRTPEDGIIDWTKSAWDIHNLIRALSPFPHYPGAFTYFDNKPILVLRDLIQLSSIPQPVEKYLNSSKSPLDFAPDIPGTSDALSQANPGDILLVYEREPDGCFHEKTSAIRVACGLQNDGQCHDFIDLTWLNWRDCYEVIEESEKRHQLISSQLTPGQHLGGSISPLYR